MLNSRSKLFLVMVLCIVATAMVSAQNKTAGPFTQFDNRLQWENEGEIYWIDALGPDALRFRSTKSLRITDEDWNILPQKPVQLEISISENKAIVKNGKIRAEIESRRGRITPCVSVSCCTRAFRHLPFRRLSR